MEKVNLAQKFGLFEEYWSPRIVGELNGQYVKLAKLRGEFVWHHHEAEDELFMSGFLAAHRSVVGGVLGRSLGLHLSGGARRV